MAEDDDTKRPVAGGWGEYSRLVLAELKRLNVEYKSLEDKAEANKTEMLEAIQKLRVDVAMLKTKSTGWGLASGGAISIVFNLVYYLITGDKAK